VIDSQPEFAGARKSLILCSYQIERRWQPKLGTAA